MKSIKLTASIAILAATLVAAGAQTSPPAVQAGPATANAKAAVASDSNEKPAWLTDLSLGLKEGYDNNVFLVSGRGAGESDSLITTVSPKLGISLLPLFAGSKALQALSFVYAPDLVSYRSEPTENYNAHRLATMVKGKADAVTFSLDNAFVFVDGSKVAPTYSTTLHDDQRSAFATGAPRERRRQIQDRAKIVFQYDRGVWFVRPTASLLYYDLLTDKRTDPGYQNYADRSDVNGGADLGYKFAPNASVTVGYRIGHQSQEQFPTAIDKTHTSTPSDYQRALLGFEGKPLKWLTLSAQAGPDFRTYPENSATHTSSVSDRHSVKFYGEAALTATPTASDALAFKYKQWQWVSSTGKVPLIDTSYDLTYRRKLSQSLALDLGARIASLNYSCAVGTSAMRYDWQYTASVGLTYVFTPNLSASLTYGADLGRNARNDLGTMTPAQNPLYREFDRQLVSLGVSYKL